MRTSLTLNLKHLNKPYPLTVQLYLYGHFDTNHFLGENQKETHGKKLFGSIYLIAFQPVGQSCDLKPLYIKLSVGNKRTMSLHLFPLIEAKRSAALTWTFHSSHQQGMQSAKPTEKEHSFILSFSKTTVMSWETSKYL